jgi:uncharacterized protein YaiI (UPF0178 family)
MLHIYVDADACPVKQEVYRVAAREKLEVTLVANAWMRIPMETWLKLQVVSDRFDAADDWIVEQVQSEDLVITADIPLADRCLKRGASVLGPTGQLFTDESIGQALATRELLADLRSCGEITGGPPPRQARDRSEFLQALNNVIQAIRKRQRKPGMGCP